MDWRETWTEVCARFFVGLLAGGGLCLLMIPLLFWPSRRVPRSLFEQLGEPGWTGWLFLVVLLAPALTYALATRVTLKGQPQGNCRSPMYSEEDLDDRAKTGCMGILLPCLLAAYGIYRITHPRKLSRITGTLRNPEELVALGISALGLALVVHAFGFVPYDRVPLLRYIFAAVGVSVFFYGLAWPAGAR